MTKLPPAVKEVDFQAVETDNPEKIKRYFEPFIGELHSYLNSTSCIRDIQNVRRRWKQIPTKQRAFHDGSFNAVRRHWYTYNWGGRSEAQFNIGLFPEYLRVGLGFEFTGGQFGNIDAVQLAYRGFHSLIDRHQSAFGDFVRKNQLRVEWNSVGQAERRYTTTEDETLKWLGRRLRPADWIFVGRLLDRREDAEILADPSRLMSVMESVFGGFLPFWEETQAEANRAAL